MCMYVHIYIYIYIYIYICAHAYYICMYNGLMHTCINKQDRSAEPSALVLASHAPAAMLRGYWMNIFIVLCVCIHVYNYFRVVD